MSWSFAPDGEILEFNAAAEAMFGRRREDVIGLNVADVIMPEALRNAHDRSLVHYVERETDGGITERVEMPAMRADGTEFRVEVSLVPIDESRQLLSAAIRDITDRLKLEEQLRQSQKLHAIGQLAGGVAHDFNNLLTIVLGYTEAMLLDIGPSHPMFEAATQIHDAGERAALLTRQLLLFGRKAILEPRPVDVNAVIQHTGAMLRRLIGEDVRSRRCWPRRCPSRRSIAARSSRSSSICVSTPGTRCRVADASRSKPGVDRSTSTTAGCIRRTSRETF